MINLKILYKLFQLAGKNNIIFPSFNICIYCNELAAHKMYLFSHSGLAKQNKIVKVSQRRDKRTNEREREYQFNWPILHFIPSILPPPPSYYVYICLRHTHRARASDRVRILKVCKTKNKRETKKLNFKRVYRTRRVTKYVYLGKCLAAQRRRRRSLCLMFLLHDNLLDDDKTQEQRQKKIKNAISTFVVPSINCFICERRSVRHVVCVKEIIKIYNSAKAKALSKKR